MSNQAEDRPFEFDRTVGFEVGVSATPLAPISGGRTEIIVNDPDEPAYVEWQWRPWQRSLVETPVDQIIRSDGDIRIRLWRDDDGFHLRVGHWPQSGAPSL
jgi:hypothetical protein